MNDAWTLYQERGAQALWDRCLGYLELSLADTMALQQQLLGEHLQALATTSYGARLLEGRAPTTYAELCEALPLTSYEYYADTLGERREDLLPEKPLSWIRTSGRSTGQHRWIPFGAGTFEQMKWTVAGLVLASMADEPGQVNLREGDRFLNMMAPPPYASGTMFRTIEAAWPVRMFPGSTPEEDALPFEARTARAFSSALTEGIDYAASIASVLAAIGEGFASRRPPGSFLGRLKNQRAFRRMAAAAIKARIAGRPMYPRDAWRIRGLCTGGMDSSLFRERIRDYWGRYPLEVFASTEGGVLATQCWDYGPLTLVPHLNFFEFLSEDELSSEATKGTTPHAVLMDELEVNKNYELVITNLHRGPLARYRTGDILRVVASSNSATGVELPQFAPYSRRTDLLEIGSFVRLTEKTIWRAIEMAEVPYLDWTARKEVEGMQPVVHLRIEPKSSGFVPAEEARARIDRALALIDPDWADMGVIADLHPLRVTYLPEGTFQRYAVHKQSEGADLAHLKPVHMNAPERVLDALLEAATVR